VVVNGVLRGVSPLTLRLPPGDHKVSVRAPGYAAVTDSVTLAAGQEAVYSPELADVAAPTVTLASDHAEIAWDGTAQLVAKAADNAGVVGLELLLDGDPLVAGDENALTLALVPADTPGMEPGRSYTLTARAEDVAGNASEATLTLAVAAPGEATAEPTATPEMGVLVAQATPAAAATPIRTGTVVTDAVHYEVTQITLPTYPYAAHLVPATDPLTGDHPLRVLDRAGYEAAQPAPAPTDYRLIVLENRYLKLEILPDLGGRLYGVTFKPTGSQELYQNPVVKPTAWGPPAPPYPAGANWWLAAGGLEWAFPVEEHGYEFGNAWGFDNVTTSNGGYMVTVFNRDPQRPHAVVDIKLEPGEAFFTLQFHVINAWGSSYRFKWWHNAMLAPGPHNTVNENVRFIWPATQATVHATRDPAFPAAGQPVDWPIYQGRDLSRLGEWTGFLGLFQRPAAQGGFQAVYDEASNEGVVRTYPPETARGAKFYASGWRNPLDPAGWTDDGSAYVEMFGGLMPTFDEWYELPAGGEVSWEERWYPAAGIGGVTHATPEAALHLWSEGRRLRLGLYASRPVAGQLTIVLPGAPAITQEIVAAPDRPYTQEFNYTGPEINAGEATVTLTGADGAVLLEYRGPVTLR
jgi:hypothetical protein